MITICYKGAWRGINISIWFRPRQIRRFNIGQMFHRFVFFFFYSFPMSLFA